MQARQHDDLLIDDIEDEVREAAEHRSTNTCADYGVRLRVRRNASKRFVQLLSKLSAQTGSLLFVPGECSLHVSSGRRLEANLHFCRRSRRSDQASPS